MNDQYDRQPEELNGSDAPTAPPQSNSPVAPPPVAPAGSPTAPQRHIARDAHGHLAEAVDCCGCGYNLQGLLSAGVCPECSTPIEQSIRGHLLEFANPDWLDRVNRGLLWIIIGIMCQIGMGILGGSAGTIIALWSSRSGAPPNPSQFNMLTIVLSIFGVGLSVILVLGAWWMTSPEPAHRDRESMWSARNVARWCMFALLIQAPANLVGSPNNMVFTPGTPLPRSQLNVLIVMMTIGCVLGIVVTIGYVAALRYLGTLARRIPRPSLAGQSRVVMWGLGISNIGMMIIATPLGVMAIQMMGNMTGTPAGQPPAALLGSLAIGGLTACVFGIGVAVFSVWAIILLFIYRASIARIVPTARANWKRTTT